MSVFVQFLVKRCVCIPKANFGLRRVLEADQPREPVPPRDTGGAIQRVVEFDFLKREITSAKLAEVASGHEVGQLVLASTAMGNDVVKRDRHRIER